MPSPTTQLAAALADRYRLERELGAGGMAAVYLAHDLKHDRKVALKVLRAELSAILGTERFLHEIRTTANLQHPHILPLHGSGEAGGVVYYVMPYVEGESLRGRLTREKQLPVDVRSFPGPGPRTQISLEGGIAPRWMPDGKGIVYRDGERFVLATVGTVPEFAVVRRTDLFRGAYRDDPSAAYFDVAPDGRRMVVQPATSGAVTTMTAVLNWFTRRR